MFCRRLLFRIKRKRSQLDKNDNLEGNERGFDAAVQISAQTI
jgi:hypothetical protein